MIFRRRVLLVFREEKWRIERLLGFSPPPHPSLISSSFSFPSFLFCSPVILSIIISLGDVYLQSFNFIPALFILFLREFYPLLMIACSVMTGDDDVMK